jgi:hypothetical protein
MMMVWGRSGAMLRNDAQSRHTARNIRPYALPVGYDKDIIIMAVWKQRVAGFEVRIHNVDHPPPHCHVVIDGRDVQVELFTLRVLRPPHASRSQPLHAVCGSH